MPQPREDNLFRESTMTFGQHLEELRNCLFKSVVGLVVGFVVGLSVGGYVVQFIQRPLARALTRYYQQESQERIDTVLKNFAESGQPSPWTTDEVKELVETEGLLADEYYVDPVQAIQELKRVYPEPLKNVAVPAATPKPNDGGQTAPAGEGRQLVRLFLWHRGADDPRLKSKGLAVTESFGIYIKASLLAGALLASPWIFWQIWYFVAAGLYPHERRYVYRYLPVSVGLFLAGAALAFFVVFEPVLNFLLKFNRSQGVVLEPRLNEWLGFAMMLPLGFGIGFQLPLVMLFLERIGVFSVRSYLAQWRIAVLVIFIVAAVLTPPDLYSMLLLAFSLTLLYFGGILLCKFMPRQSNPFGGTSLQKRE
jgi:sec-independent protein translocase protein TatC